MPRPLDWLVVTAASRAQARGYEAQLRGRWSRAARPCERWLVVPDPFDVRAGSGVATAIALNAVARALDATPRQTRAGTPFRGRRVLILHSGGDSRRLPAFAALGKLFVPLPATPERGPLDLFDLILADFLSLPHDPAGRVVVASGDVHLDLRRDPPDLNAPGVVGLASPGSLGRAAHHGVYVADEGGRVIDLLQKPDLDTSRRRGAVRADGSALLDCGVVSLDPSAAGRLANALTPHRRGDPAVDLYEHVLPALVSGRSRAAYLASLRTPPIPSLRARCEHAFDGLRGIPFSVRVQPDCRFMHVGTTREYLGEVASVSRPVRPSHSTPDGCFSCDGSPNAWIATPPVVVESCNLSRRWILRGSNVVVGVPPDSRRHVHLPPRWGLACVPLGRDRWTALRFGDADDFKTTLDAGGTLGNEALADVLARHGVDPADLWRPDEERSLWTARLWPVGAIDRVLDATAWLLTPADAPPRDWHDLPRCAAAALLRLASHARMIRRRRAVRLPERLLWVGSAALDQREGWLDAIADDREARAALAVLARVPPGRTSEASADARRLRQAADILGRFPRTARRFTGLPACGLRDAAFEAVARVVRTPERGLRPPPRLGSRVAFAAAPVRIDLAGGWTDTPPICNDRGGAVANVAITLAGEPPIRAWARRIPEPCFRIHSLDQRRSVTIRSARDVGDHRDPRDWAALAKAALLVCGLSPRGRARLGDWFARMGGGIELAFESRVPKGSGLGASSILAATIIACLDRLAGRRPSLVTIVERVSAIEQMVSTAGGWQDQCGGLVPGFKILRTRPGRRQIPRPSLVRVPPAALADLRARALLYDTGLRRLARDILQGVVWRYLARSPETERVLDALEAGAVRMAESLAAGEIDDAAAVLRDYWGLKRTLDPGTSTPEVEALIARVAPLLAGYELPGAGGGGFLFMIARSPADARRVRRVLDSRPPNADARFVEFDFDDIGLRTGTGDWPGATVPA
ncbi:MAG: hypothetical protein JNM80_15195 [Phycisphaerae bacterium]|nr:hypothetical protein [Phycisphaerae bacterium]